MAETFAERLRRLRTEKGITQQQLASMMYMNRSTIARWESGLRMPDLPLLPQLARCLGVEVSSLIPEIDEPQRPLSVIVVDDEPLILSGSIRTLRRALPGAVITGFTKPAEAVEYSSGQPVDLAFLDIEMGKVSGFELCEKLLQSNPSASVVYLTAYPNYALKAWNTGAKGFLVKPLDINEVAAQLERLKIVLPRQGEDTQEAGK